MRPSPDYHDSLEALQRAMLEGDASAILPALDASRPALPERLGVYIEGYRLRLTDAVAADYPTLLHYIGEGSGRTLIRAYVEATPSTAWTLDRYPLAFADYVATRAGDPFAAALAQLESAIAELFWSPDSPALTPTAEFAQTRLRPRTASRLLLLTHPANTYLGAFRASGAAAAPVPRPEALYLVRHHNEVRRHALTLAEHRLIAHILQGMTLEQALDAMPEADRGELATSLSDWLARWVREGFFTGSESS